MQKDPPNWKFEFIKKLYVKVVNENYISEKEKGLPQAKTKEKKQRKIEKIKTKKQNKTSSENSMPLAFFIASAL